MSAIRPLMPHEFSYIFQLLQEPLAACELRSNAVFSAQGKAAQLAPLVRSGWVTRRDNGIYEATDHARAVLTVGRLGGET